MFSSNKIFFLRWYILYLEWVTCYRILVSIKSIFKCVLFLSHTKYSKANFCFFHLRKLLLGILRFESATSIKIFRQSVILYLMFHYVPRTTKNTTRSLGYLKMIIRYLFFSFGSIWIKIIIDITIFINIVLVLIIILRLSKWIENYRLFIIWSWIIRCLSIYWIKT